MQLETITTIITTAIIITTTTTTTTTTTRTTYSKLQHAIIIGLHGELKYKLNTAL